jgi:hypothetical protein
MFNNEITELNYNPLLKELLVLYISRVYEENAIFDDYHLLAEYHLLLRDNKLHLLFEEEKFTSYMNDTSNYR